MTTREAIAKADKLRPNAIGEEIKAGWASDLDRKLADTMQVTPPESLWPEDQDLLMPAPADRVYVFWLCAMIDWAQLDGDLYAIDMAMYNEAYTEACAWWRRSHIPKVTEAGARWRP